MWHFSRIHPETNSIYWNFLINFERFYHVTFFSNSPLKTNSSYWKLFSHLESSEIKIYWWHRDTFVYLFLLPQILNKQWNEKWKKCVCVNWKTFLSITKRSYWHKINKINIFSSRAWGEKLLLLIFNMKSDFFIPSQNVCQKRSSEKINWLFVPVDCNKNRRKRQLAKESLRNEH